MNVIFTEQAREDLISIGDFIAQDNADRALSFVEELEVRSEEISAFPSACAFMPGHASHGIRRAVHGNYGIFYNVRRDAVYILRILHSAMDYEKILFPDV